MTLKKKWFEMILSGIEIYKMAAGPSYPAAILFIVLFTTAFLFFSTLSYFPLSLFISFAHMVNLFAVLAYYISD